ncbi:MAG: helix-turn-helix domain-containing protein [Bryobacterales bacterium]|nr:helix-turn-helix domain-containing protein [Bryobacterales bacterium]
MNQLKVNQRQTIVSLREQGWSKRKIARELGLDRATVRKYLAGATAKSPTPHTGSETAAESKSPTPQFGSAVVPGPASVCDPWGADREGMAGRLVGAADLPGSGGRASVCGQLSRGAAVCSAAGTGRPPSCRSGGWSARRARRCRWISARGVGDGER